MKSAAALFLITLFLFNLIGYRLLVSYMQQKANAQLEVTLDKHIYNDAQLTELKVPLHLPYQADWSSYERCTGEIEIQGVLYKYVKRKICNDTLYVMCIQNTTKMHLETAKNDFFKSVNDLNQDSKSKKTDNSKSYKIMVSEYDEYSYIINAKKYVSACGNNWLNDISKKLVSSPHASPEQPPEALLA